MRTPQQAAARLSDATSSDTPIAVLGVTFTVKVTSTDTAGAFALVECVAPPHMEEADLHWHARTTEWVYVVEGMLACTLGDHTITATDGMAITVPPRMVHAFWNPTAAPVRFLSLFAPGGCEHYVEERAAMIAGMEQWPPPNMAESLALAARHDTVLAHPSA